MCRFVLAVAACGLWLLPALPAGAEDRTIVWEVNVPTPYLSGPRSGTLTLWMTASKVRQSDGYRDWIYDVPPVRGSISTTRPASNGKEPRRSGRGLLP